MRVAATLLLFGLTGCAALFPTTPDGRAQQNEAINTILKARQPAQQPTTHTYTVNGRTYHCTTFQGFTNCN